MALCEAPGVPRVSDVCDRVAHRPAVLVSGSSPHCVVDANDKWLETCKFKREQVIGKTLKILQGPRTEKEQLAKLMRAVQEKSRVQVMLTNYDATRNAFHNKLTIEPVEMNGVAYFLATSVITFLCDRTKPLRLTDISPKARPPPPQPSRARPLPQKQSRSKTLGRGIMKAVGLEGCLPRPEELMSTLSFDETQPRRGASLAKPDADLNRRLRYAAWEGDIAKVRDCIQHGAQVDATDSDGFSALIVAARWNRVQMLRSLIMVFGADIQHRTRLGQTALDVAVEWGNGEAENYLRNRMVCEKSSRSRTPSEPCEEAVPPELAVSSLGAEPTAHYDSAPR